MGIYLTALDDGKINLSDKLEIIEHQKQALKLKNGLFLLRKKEMTFLRLIRLIRMLRV